MSSSEVDSFLAQTEAALKKEQEIERILAAFKLNAYLILDVSCGTSVSQINTVYRKKSLLIHPDRNVGNAKALDAFNKLKQAHEQLSDDSQRKILDDAFTSARRKLIKELKLGSNDTEALKSNWFIDKLHVEWNNLLIEDELRRLKIRKLAFAEEGRQKQKVEQELQQKESEREHQKQWEETRDERIQGWRNFQVNKKRTCTKSDDNKHDANAARRARLDAGSGGVKDCAKKLKKPKLLG